MCLVKKSFSIFVLLLVIPVTISCNIQNEDKVSSGKYLVEISGCNDCHTPGYAANGGAIPESEWLVGDGLGFRGPWGTTYAINLRKYMDNLTEDEWVKKAKTLKTRPPMPWWILNTMNENDLKQMYKYIKELKVVENTIPAYVPPEETPKTPFVQWPMPPK